MASFWWSAAKIIGKGSIFGGVIYLTLKNDIWTSDSEKGLVAMKSLTETVDEKLGGQYLGNINLPTDLNVAEKWNYGVAKSFDSLASAPDALQNGMKKGYNFMYEKFK